MKGLTIILMILLAISVIQLIAPGLGSELLPGGTLWGGSAHWFSSDFAPSGWGKSEGALYLLTELLPVLLFIGIGVLFWWRGKATRVANATAVANAALAAAAPAEATPVAVK